MRTIAKSLNILLALFMTLCILNPALVSGAGWSSSTKHADPDFDRASQAIKAKEFDRAIEYLNNVVAKDDQNADAYNLLGYSERMRGNLDAAFKYYERALDINPKHRGAHEYLGETYLLANNLPKAEEHLAALDKLCFFSCEEYRDLKAAIADYKEKHKH